MATQPVLETSAFDFATKSDVELATMAEVGLPLDAITELRFRGLSFSEVAEIVIPPRTLKHRRSRGERLSTEESERLLRTARVLTLADKVFGDHEKALAFLRLPDPEYQNRTGLSLLRTEAGGRAVEAMLWRIDDGIYA